jgi:hypothetical protein
MKIGIGDVLNLVNLRADDAGTQGDAGVGDVSFVILSVAERRSC